MGALGLVNFKMFLLVVTLFGGFMWFWGLGNGYVEWKTPTSACFGGRHWVKAVDKQPWLAVGKVTLLYQPWSWVCPPDHSYDPKVYEIHNGELVPLGSSGSIQTPPNLQ